MILSQKTKIDELLKKYPFLLDFLINLSPKFQKLRSPILRKTMGKVASLGHVASLGDMPLDRLLQAIASELKRVTHEEIQIKAITEKETPSPSKKERMEILKNIIRDLHKGVDRESLKRRFGELIKDVSSAEIAEMEQSLIEEGMSEEEIKRLCDVHVQVFKESLEEKKTPESVPGHPLHTLMAENRALEKLIAEAKDFLGRMESSAGSPQFKETREKLLVHLKKLFEIEKHYLKKENQLFPLLEAKGVSGPSKVMWAIHDDIRSHLKEFQMVADGENIREIVVAGKKVLTEMADMIYKEEKILFPMSLETLKEADWARIKRGEEEIGYAWIVPGSEWKPSFPFKEEELPATASGYEKPVQKIELSTGALTPEQVNLILTHLPLDISFVDEEDRVVYYSATKDRIFTRTPAVIGRKVQNCHPPKSVHMVNKILEAFRAGKRDVAEFWIEMGGKFIHIRYFAVRNDKGEYKGCLEVGQDVTGIRSLQGQKRLLDWE